MSRACIGRLNLYSALESRGVALFGLACGTLSFLGPFSLWRCWHGLLASCWLSGTGSDRFHRIS